MYFSANCVSFSRIILKDFALILQLHRVQNVSDSDDNPKKLFSFWHLWKCYDYKIFKEGYLKLRGDDSDLSASVKTELVNFQSKKKSHEGESLLQMQNQSEGSFQPILPTTNSKR